MYFLVTNPSIYIYIYVTDNSKPKAHSGVCFVCGMYDSARSDAGNNAAAEIAS